MQPPPPASAYRFLAEEGVTKREQRARHKLKREAKLNFLPPGKATRRSSSKGCYLFTCYRRCDAAIERRAGLCSRQTPTRIRYEGQSGKHMLALSSSHFGRVGM